MPLVRHFLFKLAKSLNKTVPDPLKGFQRASAIDVDGLHTFDVSILGDEIMDTPRKRAAGARVVSLPGTARAERAAIG